MIEECYLHVLDPSSNVLVESEIPTEMDEATLKEIEVKISKAMISNARKKCTLKEDGQVYGWIKSLSLNNSSLEDFSKLMVNRIFNTKMQHGLYDGSDLMIASVLYEERRYLVILDNSYREGLTHHVHMDGDQSVNDLITHKAIFTSNIMKNDRVVIVELSDMSITIIENKITMDQAKVALFGDLIFLGENENSYKENISAIHSTSSKLIEKYDGEKLVDMPKVKQMICDAARKEEDLPLDDIAEVIFHDKPYARQEFVDTLKEAGVKDRVGMEYATPSRREQVQKIKTDKGIELIIPVDYMNSDYVEFHNNQDGTITINLKYINRIDSK